MGSHAAGVGTQVTVTGPLVIVRSRHRNHVGSVADDHVRHLGPFETSLDEHPIAALPEPPPDEEGIDCGVQLVLGADDQHPLAGGQSVGLENHRKAPLTRGLGRLVSVTYHRLELGRRPVGPEQAESPARELVPDAERERQLGTDHREVDTKVRGRLRHPRKIIRSHRQQVRRLCDPRVAGSRVELCDARRAPQCVDDGVLSTAGTEH